MRLSFGVLHYELKYPEEVYYIIIITPVRSQSFFLLSFQECSHQSFLLLFRGIVFDGLIHSFY